MESIKKPNNNNKYYFNYKRQNSEAIKHNCPNSLANVNLKSNNKITNNKICQNPPSYLEEDKTQKNKITTSFSSVNKSTKDNNQIKLLEIENNILKKNIIEKVDKIKMAQSKCKEQNKIIIELCKKITKLKLYIEKNKLKENSEKFEKEMAIAAVEEHIMKELCANDNTNQQALDKIFENNKNQDIKNIIDKIPEIQYDKVKYGNNYQCNICFDSFHEKELLKQLRCKHIFHKECLSQWILNQKNCPTCNQVY